MKYVVILVVLLVLLGGGGLFALSRIKAAAANSAGTQATDQVVRTTIEKLVSANGNISSNRDVDIKCQASGIVETLPYNDVNAQVKPGEMVCQLNPKDEQPLLDTAEAVVLADQARLQEATLNWNIAKMALETQKARDQAALASVQAKAVQASAKAVRTKQLFDAKLASQEDLEADQTAAASAAADVQTAQAAVAEEDQQKMAVDTKAQTIEEMKSALTQDISRRDQAKLNVGYCKVTAPEADNPADPPRWVISSLLTNIAPGYIVQSGTSGFSAGTTIMTLSDLSHIFMLASVDESDIGQVADPALQQGSGQKVRVTVDAYPNEVFEGNVTRVAPKGVNTNNVVTFEVKIEVTSPNRMLLRPAMTATAKIICASREDVLAIPVAAFTHASAGENGEHAGRGEHAASASAPAVAADATEPATATASAPATGRRGGRGRGAGAAGEAGSPPKPGRPLEGTVTVVKSDGTNETRNVTVGLTDGEYYEVLQGLAEGETIVLNKNGADSKWKGQNQNGSFLPRGIGGGGGGGGGGRGR